MQEQQYALEMKQVSKQFPGTLAVDHVDFAVRTGEVHALMGENGAGKSTLMKMLAGSFSDYTGEIFICGKPVTLGTPKQAKKEGIAMMYQELSVAYNRTVEENLFVGELPVKGGMVDQKKLREEALEILKKVRLESIDPGMLMKHVSQHQQQLIELAKVLHHEPKILVMDEPTSALSSEEVELLFEIIREIKQRGISIVYISHHLHEIFEVADRVTVLRDGQKIDTRDMCDVTKEELVEMMIGRKVTDYVKQLEDTQKDVVLKVSNLTHYGYVHNISFDLHQGEILGIVGLAGSGRTELGRCLCGADVVDLGEVEIEGKAVTVKNMGQMLDEGVAYLTEDRKTQGLALRLSNQDNILSAIIGRLSKFFIYNPKNGDELLDELYKKLAIYPPDPTVGTSTLSGGNQQKILLAKWLATRPKVLILDEPSRGVDVGAKKLIHETIVQLTKEGISVIVLSSDLPELVSLSDRVMVMKAGHLIGEILHKDGIDESKLLLAANGEKGVLSRAY